MRNSWKLTLCLAVAALAATAPARAQDAPAGWKTQARDNGATTFTPPDLAAGEVYSVTTYDAAPLGGKTLEAYLRAFAGPVGAKAGQLGAALKIGVKEGKVVSGTGAYNGPNGTNLLAVFVAVSFDEGATIHVARTLSSAKSELLERYQSGNAAIVKGLAQRGAGGSAKTQSSRADLPADLAEGMTVGGDLVPGVYAGTQTKSGMFGSRSSLALRVYIYANGEYRICDAYDKDYDLSGPVVGKIKVDRARGMLDIEEYFALSNDNFKPDRTYCYYGRNAAGKPVIFGRSSTGATTSNGATLLFWEGPPTGRKSKSEEDAPARAAKAARDAIQTRVAPGQGVKSAQIAAIMHDFDSQLQQTIISPGGTYIVPNFAGPATYGYNAPIYGLAQNITDDTYLLLRDGTVYKSLQVAPDQFDVAASKRKEPENWGLWKTENGKMQISFGGKDYEELGGKRMAPAAPNMKFAGRYIPADADAKGAISFTTAGRFTRASVAKNEMILTKANVNSGGLAGTYTLDGYAMTLRYDSGKVTRAAFFFGDAKREMIWLEGQTMVLDAK